MLDMDRYKSVPSLHPFESSSVSLVNNAMEYGGGSLGWLKTSYQNLMSARYKGDAWW